MRLLINYYGKLEPVMYERVRYVSWYPSNEGVFLYVEYLDPTQNKTFVNTTDRICNITTVDDTHNK